MQTPVIERIAGPVGLIETASVLCSLSEPMPSRAVLLLHPHPLHGGSMGNKVITTMARAARDVGLPCVAFNFRGAGASEGVWDHGDGEVFDALAVASRMASQGVKELCLAGFSFGASMAAKLIPVLHSEQFDLRVSDLVQVAPAVENFPVHPSWLTGISPYVLFNTDDEVVAASAMQHYADAIGVSASVHPAGGHFYHGHLPRLKADVTAHWRDRGLV
jgi:uncharacterized protein